ncbi:MAG: GAF domain-containing sensor histidine kinase, partial [Spirochaetaceae bacterium]|nr:GAF domain-containing sensor histidine kinase [Spirochaetaceae bacterium]
SAEGPFVIKSSCGMGDDCTSSVVFSVSKGGGDAPRQIFFARDLAAIPDQPEREGDPEYAESKKVRQCVLDRGFRALLSVPLYVKDEEYGEITLYYRSPRDFSQEDVQLAVSVAGQAALAIENARLRSQAEQSAAFAERSRVARELHDSVTQSLYSITLYAEAVARMLASGAGSEAVKHLRELRATAQEALREMRLLIFQLSPPALDEGGLAGALQIRLDAVESRGGVKADMQVEGTENIDLRTRQELYQVAQEALNNALKHARAQSVRISLNFRADGTSLEVSDDGCGFEPGKPGGGLGLRSMRERVQQIGGALLVESRPGEGTTVRVVVPAKPTAS